jgi:hypothetical protein
VADDEIRFPRFTPRQLPRGPFGFREDPETGISYLPLSEMENIPEDSYDMTMTETVEHWGTMMTMMDAGRSTEDRLDALRRFRERHPLHTDDEQLLVLMIIEGRGK